MSSQSLSNQSAFVDRRTYFNFVKGWKRDYKKVSYDIVNIRTDSKRLMQASQPSGSQQRACLALVKQATELLKIRMASKVEAGRQRAANQRNP